MKFIQYAKYWEKTNSKKNSLRQNKCCKIKHIFFLRKLQYSSQFYFLFAILLWGTRFIFSLKFCVGFSIFDSFLFLLKFILTLREHQKTVNLFFNWDSLHARLNSHYKAWSYKKKKHKKIKANSKSL